jgi:hypothetical protein
MNEGKEDWDVPANTPEQPKRSPELSQVRIVPSAAKSSPGNVYPKAAHVNNGTKPDASIDAVNALARNMQRRCAIM